MEFHSMQDRSPLSSSTGREIERVERRTLADGTEVRCRYWLFTFARGEGAWITEELVETTPEVSFGPPPQHINDVYLCSNSQCRAIVSGAMARTCQVTGVTFCSRCVESVYLNGVPAVVWREVAAEMRRPRWLRAVRRVASFIIGFFS